MDNEKINKAIQLIKAVCSQHNVSLAFSSGKDSVVLDYLAKEAQVKVQRFHNVTTIDPKGTIPFAVKHHCDIVRSPLSFLDIVEMKGFPTMFRRFCCKFLKERYYSDYALFGIRKDESTKRSKCYSEVEDIYYYSKKIFTNRFFPLLYFSDEDIREIITEKSLECHPLYYDDKGQFDVCRRLGCIGCPLQGDRGKKDYRENPILLKQVLRRGILYHRRMGRTEQDAVLNLIYNIFYSNHNYEKYLQTYYGIFHNNPWDFILLYFGLEKDDVLAHVPKPKFQ